MAGKLQIDVLTLDSVQCAACGYMMESIAALPMEIQEIIEYKEWSIKNKEGIGKFIEMKGRVLPTIAIQGDLLFESIIPQYEELIDAMADRARATTASNWLPRSECCATRALNFEQHRSQSGSGGIRNAYSSRRVIKH